MVVISSENVLESFLGNNAVDDLRSVQRESLVCVFKILNFTAECFNVRGDSVVRAGAFLSVRRLLRAFGSRAGIVVVGQLPLVFVLGTKNNVVGTLIGQGYERVGALVPSVEVACVTGGSLLI